MTGLWIVLAAVAVALAFGGYRALTDGRARAVRVDDGSPRLDADQLGEPLGRAATFVQFSATVCAPCRATHKLLAEVTGEQPSVGHVDRAVFADSADSGALHEDYRVLDGGSARPVNTRSTGYYLHRRHQHISMVL